MSLSDGILLILLYRKMVMACTLCLNPARSFFFQNGKTQHLFLWVLLRACWWNLLDFASVPDSHLMSPQNRTHFLCTRKNKSADVHCTTMWSKQCWTCNKWIDVRGWIAGSPKQEIVNVWYIPVSQSDIIQQHITAESHRCKCWAWKHHSLYVALP